MIAFVEASAIPASSPRRLWQIALVLLFDSAVLTVVHLGVCVGYRLHMSTGAQRGTAPRTNARPAVAVLLCVRDDWMEGPAQSCLRAMGPADRLFICDDSQSPASRRGVADFAAEHSERSVVVRRSSLDGFKAGNLNHCLESAVGAFTYFMVVDHDNDIHPDSIFHAVDRLESQPSLSFLQFTHREQRETNDLFAREMSASVRVVWWLQSVRADYGLPICFGHSVVFRRSDVELVGRFPDLITEDLAITLRLLKHGQLGAYDLSLPSTESVPADYQRFRMRYVRWCTGTAMCWLRPATRPTLRQFLSDSCCLDGVLQALTLLYPFSALAMAAAWSLSRSGIGESSGVTLSLIDGIALFALTLPFIPTIAMRSSASWTSILTQSSVYTSLIVPVVCCVAVQAIGTPEFINTGNSLLGRSADRSISGEPARQWFSACGGGTRVVEWIVAGSCLAWAISGGTLTPIPLFASAASGLVFQYCDWDSIMVRWTKTSTAPVIAACVVLRLI